MITGLQLIKKLPIHKKKLIFLVFKLLVKICRLLNKLIRLLITSPISYITLNIITYFR